MERNSRRLDLCVRPISQGHNANSSAKSVEGEKMIPDRLIFSVLINKDKS